MCLVELGRGHLTATRKTIDGARSLEEGNPPVKLMLVIVS
jgi:hypothetical protein